jgi:hypothetical protein
VQRRVEVADLDQLALGADALEKHHQLQLEEDDWIDAGPAPLGMKVPRSVADEAQIEFRLQMPGDMVDRNEGLERDSDGLVEGAGFDGAEHGVLRDQGRLRRRVVYRLLCRSTPPFSPRRPYPVPRLPISRLTA